MVYYIRAKTYFNYAIRLYQEILQGKRELNQTNLRDIFLQGIKAIYALTEINPPSQSPSLEEILKKILPTFSQEEREKILLLKDLLFSEKDVKLSRDEWLKIFEELLKLIKECLNPIL